MLAAADINGFIPSACHFEERNKSSKEGTTRTVDAEYFLYWVKAFLVPWLGNYERGDPRSFVLIDNTSTHMNEYAVDAITSAGAVVIYAALYSPHLTSFRNLI